MKREGRGVTPAPRNSPTNTVVPASDAVAEGGPFTEGGREDERVRVGATCSPSWPR